MLSQKNKSIPSRCFKITNNCFVLNASVTGISELSVKLTEKLA